MKCQAKLLGWLQAVDLSSNQLTGSTPSSLDFAAYLRTLDLSNNSLSGPLPQLFAIDHMQVSTNG